MHLKEAEIMKAAGIAASRFGSGDPAIERDDFVAMAALRICQRDPTTIGTAVHVGREAIGKVVGQLRYRKEIDTTRGVATNRDARPRPTVRSQMDAKNRTRSVAGLLKRIGRPAFFFGRFGAAYPDSIASKIEQVMFDCPSRCQESPRRLTIKMEGTLSPAIERLADRHNVLLLVPDAEIKTQAASVAGQVRSGTLQEAG